MIIYLFFGLFLGFIINNASRAHGALRLQSESLITYNPESAKTIYIFLIILFISSLMTVIRYSNFYPFITNNYYDLEVNLNGVTSTGSIMWTIRYFFNYLTGFLFFILIFSVIDSIKDVLYSIIALFSASAVSAGVAIYQYFFNPTFRRVQPWIDAGRFNGTFSDPNALGAFVLLLFPIYIGLFMYLKKYYLRLIVVGAFAIYLVLLLFSGSRSAFIGIFISILIFGTTFIVIGFKFLRRRFRFYSVRKRLVIITAIGVVAILIAAFFVVIFTLPDLFISRVSFVRRMVNTVETAINYGQRAGIIEGFKSISNFRYIFWGQAMEMFKDHPVAGVGHASYIFQLPNYLKINQTGFSQIDFSGSFYLQVLSELGITGIILYIFIIMVFLVQVLRYFKRKNREDLERSDWFILAFFASFIAMLAGQGFGPHTNFDEVNLTFWLMIGLMMACVKVMQKKFEPSLRQMRISNKIRFDFIEKISLAAVILIFTSSFVFSSVTGLSININQNLYDRKGTYIGWENKYGFYEEETIDGEKFRWVSIDASEVVEKKGEVMVIPIMDAIPEKPEKPLEVKVYINNFMAAREVIEHEYWTDVRVEIPEVSGDRFTLTLVFNRGWSPKEMGLNPDTRQLAASVKKYMFVE